jgi:hypothetical protein
MAEQQVFIENGEEDDVEIVDLEPPEEPTPGDLDGVDLLFIHGMKVRANNLPSSRTREKEINAFSLSPNRQTLTHNTAPFVHRART